MTVPLWIVALVFVWLAVPLAWHALKDRGPFDALSGAARIGVFLLGVIATLLILLAHALVGVAVR